MTAAVFARTKIQPPRQRPGLLVRERVAAPLAAALAQQRLVLVVAPAGFGKTVALTQTLAALPPGTALAWVGADEADDLGRFAACLVAALDPYDLPWRVSPDALVATLGQAPATAAAFAVELINTLAATEVGRGLIVVDDVHRLQDTAVFALLEQLVERLPAPWGLVLVGRVDPPLPLARWRARGEMAEWRQDALSFTPQEVEALAAGRADAAVLFGRTGGWAAGLGLLLGAAGGGAGSAGGGSSTLRDRHVFDYLVSEVLDAMPAALRDFLLRCSVLPELSAARCAAVSGDARAAEWLEAIERRGLFVSVLDEREPTLRLHDLFRDCLAERMRRDHADELPRLLARAAADEPDPLRRIGYLASAGAWGEAETVLSQVGPEMLAAGAVPQVMHLLDRFPPALQDESPALQQLRGLCAWAHWDWLAMGRALQRAAAGWRARGDERAALHAEAIAAIQGVAVADDAGGTRLQSLQAHAAGAPALPDDTRTLLALARSWHALGRSALDEVAAPFGEVVTLLERGASPTLWFQSLPPTAFLGLPGMRAPLQRYVDGVLRLTPEEPPSGLRVLAVALQAGLALFAGRADEALQLLERADADCRWLNRPPMQTTYLMTIGAFAHAVMGHADAALAAAQALIDGLDDVRSSGRRANWLRHYVYLRLRIAAVVDDPAVQRAMAAQLDALGDADRAVFRRQRGSLAARLAALDGRWADAAAGFAQALADETALDHYGQAPELRARWAHALLEIGRRDEAAAALAPALAHAAASGEVAGLQFAGPRVLARLAAADWAGRLEAAPLARLLAGDAPSAAAAPAPAEGPLSPRELEVLERLAQGQSNKLIARALDLSPHTVKRHVANILDKLAVASRAQAAAWYAGR